MAPKHDLAVRWNGNTATVRRIDQLGGVPLYGFPKHLRIPGGIILVVSPAGDVVRIGAVKRVAGPKRVTLATGQKKKNGFVVLADRGRMHRPKPGERSKVHIRWHAVGQFRYYNAKTGHAVIISPPTRATPDQPQDPSPEVRAPSRRPYQKGIPGLPLGSPESSLVDEYVRWMGEPKRFDHRYLRGDRRWSDLFDISRWRLFEAKANIDRRSIRTAIGQLFDYRRSFPRRPSLGVLLAAHPGKAALDYILSCGCNAIWRTPSGRFADSSDSRTWSQRTIVRSAD